MRPPPMMAVGAAAPAADEDEAAALLLAEALAERLAVPAAPDETPGVRDAEVTVPLLAGVLMAEPLLPGVTHQESGLE